MKKVFIINEEFENTRIDRWLKKNVCNIPQSLIEKNLRKGNIKVNSKKEKSSFKLKKNDKVELNNFKYTNRKNNKQIPYHPTKLDLKYSNNIFIEDNANFSVINKPAGIAVQSGTKSKRNIIDILRKTKEFNGFSPYTVHRIDKETTGILIVAKNRKYAQLFTSLFRIRKIHKTYLGISVGEFEKKSGTFNDYLYYYEGKKEVKTKAITHFKVLDSNNNYTLLKLNPETGRKHQIRKQLYLHGYPILGDSKYRISDNKFRKNNNLMLHAYKINFSINNVKYKFVAKPSDDFNIVLKEKHLKIY